MNHPGHLKWIVFAPSWGFGASFIFGDLITLPLDLYYLIYFVIISVFFTIYIKKDSVESEGMVFEKNGLGNLARIGLRSFDGSECSVKTGDGEIHRPLFGLVIFWRGLIYGAIDGLLLSVISLDGHLAGF